MKPLPARIPRPTFAEFQKARIKLKYVPRAREDNYFGFNIVYFRGVFFGLCRKLGPVDLPAFKEADLARLEKRGRLFRSPLLERVKLDIAAHKLNRLYRLARIPKRCLAFLWKILSAPIRKIGR